MERSFTQEAPPEKPKWEIIKRSWIVQSPWLSVEAQTCKLPNGKIIEPFFVVQQPDWALILAQDTQGNWILGSQYRHGVGRYLVEFPAGIIGPDESPLQAAQRELLEESGYGEGQWELLQSLPVNPDRQSARFHIVLARGVKLIAETHFDDSEDILTRALSTADVNSMIQSGRIEHPHHIAAWLLNRASVERKV